jgi:hypothetical protein
MASANANEIRLWVLNDEGLYNMARRIKRRHGARAGAAIMLAELLECGVSETPNGIKYTKSSLQAALHSV